MTWVEFVIVYLGGMLSGFFFWFPYGYGAGRKDTLEQRR